MNKEDIWISEIPVPVRETASENADDRFNNMSPNHELDAWNIFSPLWAKVAIEKMPDGIRALTLRDKDPFDYAKAERVIPVSKN